MPYAFSKSVTAENVFTDILPVRTKLRVSVSVSGTFVATVTLQRRLDGANWRDVESWSSEIETTYVVDEPSELRLGVKTGDFTSGTAVCRIGKDRGE